MLMRRVDRTDIPWQKGICRIGHKMDDVDRLNNTPMVISALYLKRELEVM